MTTNLKRRNGLMILSIAAVGLLAGCSSQDVPLNLDEEIQMRDQRISQLEEEASQNQAKLEISQREAQEAAQRAVDAQEKAHAASTSVSHSDVNVNNLEGDMLPPNARAGECYARVLVPPVYETTSERMMVKEASSKIEIVPAKFEAGEEKIMVKEAGEKLIVVPATYRTVEEKVLVTPASSRMVEVPAVYETVTEKVLVTPAREYWKKGRGPMEKVDGATGEIMCLVKEDAVYNTVTRKVLKTEAGTREETIPAEYKTMIRTVIDRPASTRVEVIPAEYQTVKVNNLVSPAKENRIPIAAEYRDMTKRVMTEASYLEWRQVLCETNMDQTTILDVQKALKAKGFNPGPLDGIYGSQTQSAVSSFQDSAKLSRGALTYETVEALGLKY